MNPGDHIQMQTMTAEQFFQKLLQAMWERNARSVDIVAIVPGAKLDLRIQILDVQRTEMAS